MSFMRGSNASKLKLSFVYGDCITMSEFDIADLRSIVTDVATGSKVRIVKERIRIHDASSSMS